MKKRKFKRNPMQLFLPFTTVESKTNQEIIFVRRAVDEDDSIHGKDDYYGDPST